MEVSPAILALALVVAAHAAAAEERADAAALLRSPESLVDWVQRHDGSVEAARARVSAARSQVHQSLLPLPNPQVNASVGGWPVGDTNPRGLALHQVLNFNVGVSQTFEVLKRGPRIRSAEFGLLAERESLVATVHERVADARLALGQAIYEKQRVTSLERTLETSREMVALEKVRLEKGAISTADFERIELEATSAEAELAAARAELAEALGICGAALLAPCDVENTAMDALRVALPPSTELAALVEKHPQVQSLQNASSSASASATLERRKVLPDPTVSLGYTHDRFIISGNNPNTVMMGVSVPLPVFDQGLHTAAAEESRARALQSEASGIIRRNSAQLEGLLEKSRLVDGALTQLTTSALPRAEAVLTRATTAFRLGETTLTELLMARRTLSSLRQRVLDLQFEQFAVRNEIRRVLAVDAELVRNSGSNGHG